MKWEYKVIELDIDSSTMKLNVLDEPARELCRVFPLEIPGRYLLILNQSVVCGSIPVELFERKIMERLVGEFIE